MLPLHSIYLINLATSYVADSDYSLFTGYQEDIVVGETK